MRLDAIQVIKLRIFTGGSEQSKDDPLHSSEGIGVIYNKNCYTPSPSERRDIHRCINFIVIVFYILITAGSL